MKVFTDIGAFWMHDGNPRRPHALLTLGGHSNGFFNGSMVIRRPQMLSITCGNLVRKKEGLHLPKVDMVIGSAHGATFIAYELARHIGCCEVGFTEPETINGEKQMLLKRFALEEGTVILVCEDVMTTGTTTRKTIASIEAAGGVVLDSILVLVNRSGMSELDGRQIVALVDRELPIWTPEECPLCKQGSEAIRPKGNWSRLTADYPND